MSGGASKKYKSGNVTPRVWLNRIEVTTYITKVALFFSGSPLVRTPQLSVLAGEQSWDE